MAIELRDASLADRDEVKRLLVDYLFEFDGTTEPYPYLDAYWQENERLPLLIEADGRVVGLCLIRRREGGWSIAEFTVIPSHRRRGFGRAAVESLATRARAEGGAYLEAEVQPINRQALPFWLASGFNQVEESNTGVAVTRRSL
jgi:ribosomal protein S18 acetylase RimI-like enzyme